MKNIFSIIAVILTFVGYIPYIRDILKQKTRPHVYSWSLWGFVALIVFALQVSDNAGPGAFVTLAAVVMVLIVVVLGFRLKGKKDIKAIDTIFLILALISLGIWLIADQPVISAILMTLIDFFGFFPTIRKSWKDPFSETLSFYIITTFRFALALLSIENYSIITTLYPLLWFLADGLFALMLVIRRKKLKNV